MKHFYRLLINTLVANVTTSFLWFALTFWVYLETENVMLTGILGGSFMLGIAATGILFGTLVDKHKKKQVMQWATFVTAAMYAGAAAVYFTHSHSELLNISSLWFWLFSIAILVGGLVENIRNIALSTCVTIMLPAKDRAHANGLVGMVQGLAFALTSVFSGLVIGQLGMGWAVGIALALTLYALFDLTFVTINEKHIKHDPELKAAIDIKGAWKAIRAVPGLLALILFATFNNLIGGVYMTLLDPYGLTLVPVETWGIILAVVSFGFVFGGMVVAKKGLGPRPLRILLLVNIAISGVGMFMAIRESIWLLIIGLFIYFSLFPVAEAAEQTTLQKVVPVEKQGRVFGFGQSVEATAAPVTAFAIGPLAQHLIIPYMNGDGEQQFSWLLGTGEARGIALLFLASGLILVFVTIAAFYSRSYKRLSQAYER